MNYSRSNSGAAPTLTIPSPDAFRLARHRPLATIQSHCTTLSMEAAENMTEQQWQRELNQAFQRLDDRRIRELAEERPDAKDDATRLAFAFAALAQGDLATADQHLAATIGDGTTPIADLAYVRAFRRERDGDFAAVVETLSGYLGDTSATHPERSRLRVADALVRLRRTDEVVPALGPLLEPPGTEHTLEAHFIVLEAMLLAGSDKEKLIEHVVLIDALIEKGFRLHESANVVFYGNLLNHYRIEPPLGPLLNAHDYLLDDFETDNRDEIMFLLTAGEKYKAPAAVRAAGRSYAKGPFPLEGYDPERAAYIFSTHEEHEAARQSILMGFPRNRINKEQNLWGPLLLASYYGGRWKEALELIREHREEIPRLPMADHAQVVRAVCEYQLGRYGEAVQSARKAGRGLYLEVTGFEAAVLPYALGALGRTAEISDAAEEAFELKSSDPEFINDYATAVLTEFVVRDNLEALREWIRFLSRRLKPEARANSIQRIADMALEWGMNAGALEAAMVLEAMQEPARAGLVHALIAAESGDTEEFVYQFSKARKGAPPEAEPELLFIRARALRRLGLNEQVLDELDNLLRSNTYPRRHAALAMKEDVLRRLGREPEAEAAREEALAFIRTNAQERQMASMMMYELNQLSRGDNPQAWLELLHDVLRRQPGNVEVLRLARRVIHAFDRTPEQEEEARTIAEAWKKENFSH